MYSNNFHFALLRGTWIGVLSKYIIRNIYKINEKVNISQGKKTCNQIKALNYYKKKKKETNIMS